MPASRNEHAARRAHRAARSPSVALVVLVLALLASASAFATHDVDHRYTVYGVVRDGGAPVAGEPVRITGLGGQPLAEGVTAADGSYRVVLHVHDDQRGQRFWVTVRGETRAGSFDFEPGDRATPRTHRLDFPG